VSAPELASGPRAWWRFRVFAFLLLGLAGVDALLATQRDRWRAYSPDDYREKRHLVGRAAPDLLLVGGSPVSEGLDPSAFDGLVWRGTAFERPFNYGLPGGTTTEFWHALKNGVRRPPRLLVYGITASDLNDRRQEPHGAYALMTGADLADWCRDRPRSAEWAARQFAQGKLSRSWQLFRYRNAVRLWAADAAERLWPGSFPETAAEARRNLAFSEALRRPGAFARAPGFLHGRYDVKKATGAELPPFDFFNRYRIDGGHLGCLHRLLDWSAGRGVEVVLVDMPVTADLEEKWYAAEFAQYRDKLAEIERARSLTVIRATREAVGLTDAHFADQIHLNADGSARLSAWLRDRLEAVR
jgi:hypothetical protein